MEMSLDNKEWFIHDANTVLFQKGPFSQWWGGGKNQNGGFRFEGVDFNCCEQFMMATKAALFGDKDSVEKILAEPLPREQKKLGRSVVGFDEETWNRNKKLVVFVGNLWKFRKHHDLRALLLATGSRTIAEAAPWDNVWGIGVEFSEKSLDISTWKGQNLLGKALMAAREALKYTHEI